MTTTVEKTILVNVPISTAYNQWTQFEDFPQFMGGVQSVTQLSEDRLEWVAEIAGVRREWQARIIEQIPDRKVAWAATEGATNSGAVTFSDAGEGQTSVHLWLEYEPEGLVEKVGDKLNIVENQAERDLERFKAFIESEGYATGAWRGSVTRENPDDSVTETVASSDVDPLRATSSEVRYDDVPASTSAGVGYDQTTDTMTTPSTYDDPSGATTAGLGYDNTTDTSTSGRDDQARATVNSENDDSLRLGDDDTTERRMDR